MAIKTNVDINVRTNGTEHKIDQIGDKSKRASAMVGKLKLAVAAIAGSAIIRGIVNTNIEFEKLNASLKTVTGSYGAAAAAFANLEEFTTSTPYQLNEVVGAFIKLKALGLDPSNEALMSYGNTASAMGKSLNQMIEAVADAATGEFERLKEFGIKAKSEGDKVSFTFRGTTTTIKKSANEISEYLRKIGDEQFASGMADQMDTLGGVFSNFEDSVDALSRAILQDTGLSEAIKTLTSDFTDGLKVWTALIKGDGPIQELGEQIDQLKAKKQALELSLKEGFNRGAGGIRQIWGFDPEENKDKIKSLTAEITKLHLEVLKIYDQGGDDGGKGGIADQVTGPETDKLLQQTADKFVIINKALRQLREEAESRPVGEPIADDLDLLLDRAIAAEDALNNAWADAEMGITGYGEKITDEMRVAEDAIGSMTSALEDELVNAALNGELSFKKMADAIIADLVRIAIRSAITAPLMSMFGITPTANANGNIFESGKITPFANGGVVNKPTLFPMANGTGLMGEAGPEAIVPLKRGSDGKLGIAGGGGGGVTVITNNYSNSNVEVNESDSPQGGKMIELIISDQMNKMVKSGRMDRVLKPYGVNRRGIA